MVRNLSIARTLMLTMDIELGGGTDKGRVGA